MTARNHELPLPSLSMTPSSETYLAEEWLFTGRGRDNLTSKSLCSICGRHHVRYQYQIRNKFTHHREWAGESCLLQSGVTGFLDGRPVAGDKLKPAIRDARQAMLVDKAQSALMVVAEKNGHPALIGALKALEESGSVSPNQAAAIYYAANKEGIEVAPGLIKVTMKKKRHQEQVRTMDSKLFGLLVDSMDKSARSTAEKIRGYSE